MLLSSETTFKASAIFMAIFGLQFVLIPDQVMSDNFQDGSYELDKWHYFIMRGMGAAFLSVVTFYWNAADDADKYMKGATFNWLLISILLPWNAQMNLPVKMPMHLVAVLGTAFFSACHVNCLMAGGKTKTK